MLRKSLAMLIVVAMMAPVAMSIRGEPPLALEPQDGLLLLPNGEILSGKITRAGDYYYVALPQGEMQLAADKVELFCRTLDEGYVRKRAAIIVGQVEDHLNLAQWCIRHGLLGYAARELTDASAADASHPKIELLSRRLELAQSQPASEKPAAASVDRGPSNDDLDRMVRGMPPGTVEAFTQTIQPLLLNHCSTAGCHGPDSGTKYSLQRTALGKASNRRLTQRNLFATLEHVHASNPADSPLLQMSIREHGTAKTPVLTNRDTQQYRQLAWWVYCVSRSTPAPQADTVSKPPEPLLQTLPGVSKGNSPSLPKTAAPPVAGTTTAPAADPFDPALFNQREAAPK